MRRAALAFTLAACGPTIGVPAGSGTEGGGSSSTDAPDPPPTSGLPSGPSGTSVGSTEASSESTGLPDDLPDCGYQDGELTIIACDVNVYTRIALDDAFVYFSASDGVFRVPHAGGAAVAVAGGTSESDQFALDGAYVYWTEFEAGNIVRAPREGGSRETLASGLVKPNGLVVNDERLYFTQYAEGLDLQWISVEGGEPTGIYEVPALGIELAASGDYLFWGTTWNTGSGVVQLHRGTFEGAPAETRSSAARTLERLVSAPPYMYLIRYGVGDSMVGRALIEGAGSEELLAGFEMHPWELALDSSHAYWTWTLGDNADVVGGLDRLPLAGGGAEPVLTDLELPHAIEVHGDHLYFTDADRLVRTLKPL